MRQLSVIVQIVDAVQKDPEWLGARFKARHRRRRAGEVSMELRHDVHVVVRGMPRRVALLRLLAVSLGVLAP